MNRGAMEYIPSGAVRLLSPIFNLTPKDYQSYQSFGKMYPASVFPGSKGLVSVDVEVDGVVYNDGTFIGEDKTHILQRYVMARFASRDEARAALRLINSSTVPKFEIPRELQQMFSKEFQWGVRAQQDTLLALYVRSRGETSRDFQEILDSRGLSGFESVLQRIGGLRPMGRRLCSIRHIKSSPIPIRAFLEPFPTDRETPELRRRWLEYINIQS